MRVTSNAFYDSLRGQLNNLEVRQNQLQTQASTGLRIQSLEDDPQAAQEALALQSEEQTVAQYQANITQQQQFSDANYTAIKSLKTISDRANEIATLADGLKSPQDLAVYREEITQLIQQAVQVANSQNGGQYLFAGTRSDQPPFVLSTDANGLVTSVSYQGNAEVALSEIAQGVTTTAQVVGANTSGNGPRGLITDASSGADFFNHLISLQNNLAAGNVAVIASTDRPQLAKDDDNLIFQIGQNGVGQARLQAATAYLTDRSTALQTQVSQLTGADLAQTLTNLSQTQTAYQAALQAGAKIMGLTLMDYLH
jgi:flagellar hook-associated protein 3 FlgL